ncbi:MAG: hypothetical protein ACRD0Z_01190 [Acidimicrobiales bacterium]
MEDRQWLKDTRGRDANRRAKLQLGIGASQALTILAITAALTALLVYSFEVRWPALIDVLIGAVWALAVGGYVIVPVIGSAVADALSQFGKNKLAERSEQAPTETDEWEERRHIRPEVTDIGLHLPASQRESAREGAQAAKGFDWAGFIVDVSVRLQDALGDGYTAEGSGSSLVLRKGEQVRRINLGSILQPPPLDVSERAMRACLKMMDEAQMFAMRVKHEPWPERSLADQMGPSNLPRPRVRMDGTDISMSWIDSHGSVLKLQALPLGEAHPGPVGSGESAW